MKKLRSVNQQWVLLGVQFCNHTSQLLINRASQFREGAKANKQTGNRYEEGGKGKYLT